jgi:hypothetical protein
MKDCAIVTITAFDPPNDERISLLTLRIRWRHPIICRVQKYQQFQIRRKERAIGSGTADVIGLFGIAEFFVRTEFKSSWNLRARKFVGICSAIQDYRIR